MGLHIWFDICFIMKRFDYVSAKHHYFQIITRMSDDRRLGAARQYVHHSGAVLQERLAGGKDLRRARLVHGTLSTLEHFCSLILNILSAYL